MSAALTFSAPLINLPLPTPDAFALVLAFHRPWLERPAHRCDYCEVAALRPLSDEEPSCPCTECRRPDGEDAAPSRFEIDDTDEQRTARPYRPAGDPVFGPRPPGQPSRMSSGYGWDPPIANKPSSANFDSKPEPARADRPLTDNETARALAALRAVSADLQGAVWIELVNPPADVEQPADLGARLALAVARAKSVPRQVRRECVMASEDLEGAAAQRYRGGRTSTRGAGSGDENNETKEARQ